MSGYVNIGRTDDPAYRYKMPRLIGKVEGRGNGIKTVVVNIVDLGTALHRDPDEVLKFMGCELGAQIIWIPDQERGIVNGAHKDDDLQELVNLYVDKFVLCPTCKYPETSYTFKLKRDEIYHNCKACGAKDHLVDEGHRLCKFILNKVKLAKKADSGKGGKKERKARRSAAAAGDGDGSPGSAASPDSPQDKLDKEAKKKAKKEAKKAKKAEKKAKKKAKKEKKKKKKQQDEGGGGGSDDSDNSSSGDKNSSDGEEWASLGAAPVVHDTKVETASPAEAMEKSSAELAAFIAEGKDTRLVIEKLTALQLNYKLAPKDRCGMLFTALFGPCTGATDFVKAFTRFKTIFRQLITGNEAELVGCFDRHFTSAAHKGQLAVVPLLLKLFSDAELLSDALAHEWFEAAEPMEDRYTMVDAASLAAVKAKAKAFIEQLDDSSDSSDSDSD